MFRIAKYFDLFARSFIIFLVSYLWLTFYIKNIALVFVCAFAIMTLINIIIAFLPKRKHKVKLATYVKPITVPIAINPVFCRARIKRYLIIGLIIFGTSFIVRFNIYYIIVATIMFSFALASMINVQSTHDDIPEDAFQRDNN